MKFHNFKPYAKYGLFLILVISLAGTASAATGHPGGIALSWDDEMCIDPCYQNLELFQKYNATCTMNVNTNDLSTSEQSTKNNLNSLYSAGWEISAHGHNHVDSVEDLKNYTSAEWLDKEIIPNIVQLKGYGYPVYSFAYPLGSRNETTDALLAQYFRTLRSSEYATMGGQNVNETLDAYYKWDDTPLVYGVEIDDNSGVSLESIKSGIDYAIQNEYVLVLYGHTITSGTPTEYQTSTSKLEEILKYTKEKNGTFYHMGELGNSSWVQPSIPSNVTGNVTANFTVSKDNVVVRESVTFMDHSVNQTSELLDFGDGSTSTTADVTHVYTTPGPYTVTLTVTNDVSSQSMTKTITVITGHQGGIALSWDDVENIDPCYENLQTFNKYNATSTVNLNSLSGIPQSRKDNLTALHNNGWEIAAHGYNHVDSVAFLNNHTSQELLDQEITPNIAEITGYGYQVYSFAYPYGSQNDTTDALLAPYFRTLRTTNFGTVNVNESAAYYKWNNATLVYAIEIDDQSNVSLESIQYGIDEAIKYGYVLVLYGHKITPTVTGDYQTSTSRLDSILNYTYQKGGKFYHMGDLGNSSWVQSSIPSNVTANFTVSKDNVVVGENVTFVDYSVNQTSELLDFGDGSNSSTANVNHAYTTPGTYTATLTVKNGTSSQSMSKTITVVTGHNGGIALSWDDVQNVDLCYQNINMFKQYNATCTMSVNKLSGWGEGTINNLTALHNNGWEIAAHGYNHEDPIAFINAHNSQEWLDQEILPNIAETTGYGYPYSFAYPYGSQNDITDALLAPYFRTLRTTNFGTVNVNESAAYYKWDNARLVYAVEIDDQSNVSLESIQYGIDEAIKYGYVLVLYGHSITPTITGDYQTSTSRLDSILNYTYQKGGKFYHMGDLGNSSWVQPSISYNVTANFISNSTTGFAPLNVAFTDTSTGLPTSWSWDFGDGATSTEQNPTHTYSSAGTYTVKLTVSNANSTSSKTAPIIVDKKSNGGSSHSSGGGGGSPEPAKNVEVKELSQVFIANGKNIQFDFTKNATCVVYVGFDSKKTVGKTTTIAEQLKSKSTLVSSLSEGEVYKYFNVWVGNSGFASSTNIDNPTICFKVEKSWVQDKKIDKDSITLNRYSDKKWEQLPASLFGEDSKYLYFTADVPGYSFFAITGKTTATPEKTETEIRPDDSDNSEDMENTSSEANQESGEEENTGMPGFEIVYGVAGLLAVFLYIRR
jgi:PGF-pre-PGF domain-containing protein